MYSRKLKNVLFIRIDSIEYIVVYVICGRDSNHKIFASNFSKPSPQESQKDLIFPTQQYLPGLVVKDLKNFLYVDGESCDSLVVLQRTYISFA